MAAEIKKNILSIWVCRCRGKYDNPFGEVISDISELIVKIWLVRANGRIKRRELIFQKNDVTMNIDTGRDTAEIKPGWPNFLETKRLGDWVIKNNVHIYFKVRQRKMIRRR